MEMKAFNAEWVIAKKEERAYTLGQEEIALAC